MPWNLGFVRFLTFFSYLLAFTSPLPRSIDASNAIASSLSRSGGNSSSVSPLYISRNASLSIPQIPDGFSVDIDHHDAIPLRPLGVYVTAVEAMFILSLLPWDALASQPYTFNVRPYQVKIYFEDIFGEYQYTKMRHSHMVIGLYVAVLGTAERYGHGFVAETITLKVWDQEIGICTIYPHLSAADVLSISDILHLNTSGGDDRGNFPDTKPKAGSLPRLDMSVASLDSRSGSFPDPDDPRVRVHWRYRFLPLASRDVFLAILDGLALAAQADINDPCRELNAFSEAPQRKVAISVTAVRGTRVALNFTYRHAARMLLLISRLIVTLGKYDEMVFWADFNGVRFVLGDIMSRDE
ncbi:hypothetical protein G7Y79_00012g031830 [Physcia stellaris]|nr:hypothetical protein G7Y79_00012g031830 [Physcia stellaris]